ncbi:polyketide synthase, putative [Talaromyces stipitatus ATCC 10500]|uniref:Polyketide synthase, putative n=1 Tax=Talaromyces stipitatus (strain ATCC 10500 / CBS 375.48 / QM 6759 / NRRL 1006) TaxID=441959 RepID=B8LV30_TALSN|nr:polyketide synthase, putative [Talaromyces stipitatus ATCC 10500]EED22651.1 polyketide synthase, putative [Talaromyces stipitatus ATCC 10500]
MVSRIANPCEGNIVLLFGPQALSFDQEAFLKLRATILGSLSYRWVLDVVDELSSIWTRLVKDIPILDVIDGGKKLKKLNNWIQSGDIDHDGFPLPNILLSPLVVITQLTQYASYLQDHPVSGKLDKTETLGFCTGILSALAVSSSSGEAISQYGAVAVRLAMVIGAIVDGQDESSEQGPSKSLATAWQSTNGEYELKQILNEFPDAYTSVHYDQRRATVTTSTKSIAALQKALRDVGIIANEVGLVGRFHSHSNQESLKSVIDFTNTHPGFQFPELSQLVFRTHFTTKIEDLSNMKLHHAALRQILVDKSEWYQLFESVQEARLSDKDSLLLSFGPERPVPPSIMRVLSSQVIHIADVNEKVIERSDTNPYLIGENDIAVVGMSLKVAGADDVEEFWELLLKGESQHQEVPKDRVTFETVFRDIDPKRKWFGNFIRDHDAFDHRFFKKSPREISSTDPQQRHMLQCAYQAVEQSGYFRAKNPDKKVGCYVGVCAADYENNIACHAPNAFSATGNLKSFIAGKISHYFGWTGPGLTIDTACSSSAVAVHQACRAILTGECSAALAGGTNVITNPLWFQNLAGASFLSQTGQCKPFDAKADGYCRGEGIAAVFLKKLSSAIKDGDQILATIAGSAVYQNQNCTPIFVPNAPSLSDLFRDVVGQARLEPKQITVVEAHGTGTPVGDPAEYESIHNVLGGINRTTALQMSSVKGLVGHTECTSGLVSLVKTILMIQEAKIPPQASFSAINPHIHHSPDHHMEIPTKVLTWNENFRAALINNYGASGSNASMVVVQAPFVDRSAPTVEGSKFPFWFTGPDDRTLRAYASRFIRFLNSKSVSSKNLTLANISFNVSRQSNRNHDKGLIFGASSLQEVEQKLSCFANGGSDVNSQPKTAPRPVILCFGGQVSTFVGLDQQLYEHVTILRQYLDQCEAIITKLGESSIFPGIFQRTAIEDPVYFQTMLFSVQYSSALAWIASGVEPVAVVGHSFGELTALCVSGALSLEHAIKMVIGRAKVIRELWGSEKGSMIAVEGDIEQVQSLLSVSVVEGEAAATIACYNGTRSFTLAGSAKAIEGVAKTASTGLFSSMRTKVLNVTNAFHSTLVEPLITELEKVGSGLTFCQPTIRLERAIDASPHASLTSKFVAEHMRFPVYFNHAVQRLAQEFPSSIWLEAGSNSTITTMASRALGSSGDHHFQAISITNTSNGITNLADATVSLWKNGLDISFWAHSCKQTYSFAPLLLPPYQFEKARHWIEMKKPSKSGGEPTVLEVVETTIEELPKTLLTFVGYEDRDQRQPRFRINTMIPKYEELVSGHIIANTAAICPATVEVDLAIEGLRILYPDVTDSMQPQIHSVDNQSPICVDTSRFIWLQYQALDNAAHTWSFKIYSTGTGKEASTTHVTGKILLRSLDDPQTHADFARLERFVNHERCAALLKADDADDVIQGRNIYKAFSEIVNYGEQYRGLQKLVGKGAESAGRVVMNPSSETWLDAHLSDTFSQVGGIWVNCMTDREPTDMYIASGFEQWIRSPNLRSNTKRPGSWDVFALHQKHSDRVYVTDIFIFNGIDGKLTEVILGINYARVAKLSMSKLLSRLTAVKNTASSALPSAATKLQSGIAISASGPVLSTNDISLPQKSPKKVKAPKKKTPSSQPDITGKVRAMLVELSGLEPEEMKEDVELANIGIDSLMGMELAREIEDIFKCSLPEEQLVEVTTFKALLQCIRANLPDSSDDNPDVEEDDESLENTRVFTPSDVATSVSSARKADVTEFLVEFLGIEESIITRNTLLRDLGVDSLLSTELRADISSKFGVDVPEEVMLEDLSVHEFDVQINGSSTGAAPEPEVPRASSTSGVPSTTARALGGNLNLPASTVLEAFHETKLLTDKFIEDYQCAGYIDTVLPKQDQLCIALAVEAFEHLGVSLKGAKAGQKLEPIKYLPQHDRLAEYLYMMLEKGARLIDIDSNGVITRTAVATPTKSSNDICQQLNRDYPDHNFANRLTQFCGLRLADVLTGKIDGIKLIFGSSEGRELVSGLYGDSLLNKLAYEQMKDFLRRLISKLPMHDGPLKILEMGAGTGGTTKWIVPMLAQLNVPIEYTYTDLAPSFVAAARQKFKNFPYMKFRVHDIEKQPADDLLGTQHIILASNAVHATHSLTVSTRNIRKALRPDGFLMMLEMTETVYWVDVIFGLLEGWWLFEDGRRHAIAHQSRWEKDLESVGFGHVDYTDGHRPEVNIQRIFIALASGQRYDRIPIPPKAIMHEAPKTDIGAREAAVNKYLQKAVSGFTAVPISYTPYPVLLNQGVLVTGSTGSLGSHLVAHLANLSSVKTVFCVNRVSRSDALKRQQDALLSRGISLTPEALSKLVVIETDTHKPFLGLQRDSYDRIVHAVSHIIHNAWPMSGKRALMGFEQQFVVMRNLVNLANEASTSGPRKITFQLISSISTVGYYPVWSGKRLVPEMRVEMNSVLDNGYSDAKLVCERMLDETLHKHPDRFRPMVVRLGQVAGSSTSGYWNPMEHFSFLIKSSQTLRAFPALEGELSWTPVDAVASTLGDLISGDHRPYPVYHIDNPVRQQWLDTIPVLVDALGIPQSNVIPFKEWVGLVRRFPGSEVDNPAVRLIDFLDDNFLRMSCGGLLLDTTKSLKHSLTLAAIGPVSGDVARKYIQAWKDMGFLH